MRENDTRQPKDITLPEDKLNHIGGVNAEAGGVDPDIDRNLMRLSGGP
ncbi:MAG TPA: hypothetical protein PKA10_05260 [Selenomonadales bacterium]|nr:hypothetical protein [Selenomonadales bacterium]